MLPCLTQSGIATVRTRPPLPRRSGKTYHSRVGRSLIRSAFFSAAKGSICFVKSTPQQAPRNDVIFSVGGCFGTGLVGLNAAMGGTKVKILR